MAQSRVDKLGTIFSRITSLLKCGAVKQVDKPLWYDVYQAFPPIDEPTFARRVFLKEIKPILYPEDRIRAKFHQGINKKSFKVTNLDSVTTNDITQRAILLTYEFMRDKNLSEDEALKMAAEKLAEENAFRSTKKSMFKSSRSRTSEAVSRSEVVDIPTKVEPTDLKNISEKNVDVSGILKKEAQGSETAESEDLVHNYGSLADNFKKAVDDASKRKTKSDDDSKEE